MFLKDLIISTPDEVIRKIEFHRGFNFIVDETLKKEKENAEIKTGNNIGKTTVLKLVDFCLGAQKDIIYTDAEEQKKYDIVEKFLIDKEVVIKLTLVKNINNLNSEELVIERNFLTRKKMIKRINGENKTDSEFMDELSAFIFPEKKQDKPTFRQLISHNIRYKVESLQSTLKTVNSYTSDIEYETLNLYLLGCPLDNADRKHKLIERLKQENNFYDRLTKNNTKTNLEMQLYSILNDIKNLEEEKSFFNTNENFKEDLKKLNIIKYEINKLSSKISKINIKKELILEAKKELQENKSNIDLEQLRTIYSQAKSYIKDIQKTFEDMVKFHNNMVEEKIGFIIKDLPKIEEELETSDIKLKTLLKEEKELASKVSKGDSFKELENIIVNLNQKYQEKGELENKISQLSESEDKIADIKKGLSEIKEESFDKESLENLKKQVMKFNKYFSMVSEKLYNEKYLLTYEEKTHKKTNEKFLKFSSFNANMSTGKKHGEILCFDLAYILFADSEGISCLHFLMNDQKELMHSNQFLEVANFLEERNIQLVFSILKEKVPQELNNDKNIILRLSEEDKLFRIEKNK